jgi:hypothetical protein
MSVGAKNAQRSKVLVQFRINVCFYQRMVFWALCRQDCGPKLGSSHYFFGQRSDVELIFLNLLCQLYAADGHGRCLESLESEHRPDSLFYPAMILLDYVIQVFRGAMTRDASAWVSCSFK